MDGNEEVFLANAQLKCMYKGCEYIYLQQMKVLIFLVFERNAGNDMKGQVTRRT